MWHLGAEVPPARLLGVPVGLWEVGSVPEAAGALRPHRAPAGALGFNSWPGRPLLVGGKLSGEFQ